MTTTAPPARSLSIGVGVGAIVTNDEQQVFLARRGPQARNEQGLWACPGGALALGETLEAAIRREYREEFGMEIEVVCQLVALDHLLPDGEQWVSVAFVARHVAGEPRVLEPGKCLDCGWFAPDALPVPLSPLAQAQWHAYCCVEAGSRVMDTQHGSLAALMPPAHRTRQRSERIVIVETARPFEDIDRLRALPGVYQVTQDGTRLDLGVPADDPILPLAIAIIAEACEVTALTAREPELSR